MKMMRFIKDYFVNILLGIIAIVLFRGVLEYVNYLAAWLIEGFVIGFAICLPKRNNEAKEFKFFTKFKVIMLLIMIAISIYLLVKCNTATGWDSLGYAIIWLLELVWIALTIATNFIIRIYYRIRYKQKFKKGTISNCIFVFALIIILVFGLLLINLY